MAKDRPLSYGDRFQATWTDAIAEFVSTAAAGLRLSLFSATAVQIQAGANSAQATVGIDGLWRYRTADITASATGAAGVKDIYVTASANSFTGSSPSSDDPDATHYAFGLVVVSSGGTPALGSTTTGTTNADGTGSGDPVSNFRKIGELDWDGAKITGLRQLVGLTDSTAPLNTIAAGINIPAQVLKGLAGQLAPLSSWRDNTGTENASMSAAGALVVASAIIGGQAAVVTNDGRLTDQRTPLDNTVTAAKVHTSLKGGPAAGVEALRALGATATTAAAGNDSRLSDARTPTGTAGGDLTGTYPNPTVAAGVIDASKVHTSLKGGPLAAVESLRALGATATTACAGNDSRLSDSRAPNGAAGGDLTGTYPNPTVGPGTIDLGKISSGLKGGQAAGTESLRSLGVTATTACAGNDSRLSDSRAPNGAAGGDLAGTFPNPTLANQSEYTRETSGTYAARPAAGTAGRRYYATDIEVEFRDTGSIWKEVGGDKLGTVKMHYPLNAEAAPFVAPWGYAFCDGTAWSSITNDLGYSSGNIPDTRGKMLMGADKTLAKLLAGTHNVNSGAQASPGPGGRVASPSALDQLHSHGYAHSHGYTHTHDIAHTHTTPRINTDGSDRTLNTTAGSFGPSSNTLYKVQAYSSGPGTSFYVPDSTHSHGSLVTGVDHLHSMPGRTTDSQSTATTSSQSTATTDSQSVSVTDTGNPTAGRYADLRGDAVGFLVIMKVKNT